MAVIAVVGGQWGDEGKGKIVDQLAGSAQVVIRAHGGDNAGHTVVNAQGKFALHLVPAGIFNPQALCIIGAGVALNPASLLQELDVLHQRGVSTRNLLISERAHLVMPYHLILDAAEERRRGAQSIGTTRRGIGPTYVDKSSRIGLRAGDLLDPQGFRERVRRVVEQKNALLHALYGLEPLDAERIAGESLELAQPLLPHIQAVEAVIHEALDSGKTILMEGANGTLLDLDHGTYPYVTTSSPTVAGMCLGAGIGPRHITHALGVFKAYCTRVGAGPMPTELFDEVGEALRREGHEFGTTTGRPRRCGWFDAVASRHSMRVNGFDSVALTRLDILSSVEALRICVAYELDGARVEHMPASAEALARCRPVYEAVEGWSTPLTGLRSWRHLPVQAQRYVRRIETLLGAPVGLIGVGENRDETIFTDRSLADLCALAVS
ncbi:MAG: adenylosuccinate synthase [Chloroflexi bacterium]|nr:adenylosuccinate synthase [Chloroflexota bacterium]